jgi:hypothetical protein
MTVVKVDFTKPTPKLTLEEIAKRNEENKKRMENERKKANEKVMKDYKLK